MRWPAASTRVVVGAGLPLDLPDLARDHPERRADPDPVGRARRAARGAQMGEEGRLPDAIVIEHPRLAGGHLGAAKVGRPERSALRLRDRAARRCMAFFRTAGIEGRIPLIAAGGIGSLDDIRRLQALGAAAVQLGTAFAVTHRMRCPPEFKRVLAEAAPEDMVEFTSVAGLPARAVRTPWLDKYLRPNPGCRPWRTRAALHHALRLPGAMRAARRHAGLGPVLHRQAAGPRAGGPTPGRACSSAAPARLPFGTQIRPVLDLMQWLLGGLRGQPRARSGLPHEA